MRPPHPVATRAWRLAQALAARPGRLAWLPAAAASTAALAGGGDLTRYVDPFIGTDGTGHVTPAAMVPFGMVAPC